jgi:hypothetical protein
MSFPANLRPVLRAVVALGVLAFAGIQAGPATAAPAWQAPVSISKPGVSSTEVAVAVGAAGEAVAVWTARLDTGTVIQSGSRPAGGTWSAPVDISGLGEAVTFVRSRPRIAINAAGEALAVWVLYEGGHRLVQSASRPPGGAWSPPVTLSPLSAEATHPEIALNDAGEAVAVWDITGSPSFVAGASRPPGGTWSAPVSITAGDEPVFTKPRVAIDSAGEAVAVWEHTGGKNLGYRQMIQGAARPPGSAWSAPATLSKGRDAAAKSPEIAIGGGEAVAVWEGGRNLDAGPSIEYFVRSASRLPGGKWSSPIPVSTGHSFHPSPQLAVNATGKAVVAWEGEGNYGPTVMSALRSPGRDWTSPRRIDGRRQLVVTGPDVGIDAAGEAVAVWGGERFGPKGVEIDSLLGASRPRGGTWSAPARIARLGDGLAEVAVSPNGEAVVVWQQLVRDKGLVVKAAARPGGR